MTDSLQVALYEGKDAVFMSEFDEPVVLGRQCEGEQVLRARKIEPPVLEKLLADRSRVIPPARRAALLQSGAWRVVIASLSEDTVGRQHGLIEPLPQGGIRVTNLSERAKIRFEQGYSPLEPGAMREMATPLGLVLGQKTVRVQRASDNPMHLRGLAEATVPPGSFLSGTSRPPTLALPSVNEVEISSLIRWLQATMGVLQSAAASSDFFSKAAQAVVDIVGLDSGRVLVWADGRWETEAQATAPQPGSESEWRPSSQVLHRVRAEKRTFWESSGLDGAPSLVGIKVVVAAPILNRQGEVIGALYGDRRQGSQITGAPEISSLEAMLVELLASGVAAGLARLEQERALVAARVQFEQFFTPELASQLAAEPNLLQGRDSEVTLLFCDIRSFSRHSAKLGPPGTVDLINDVMGALSTCVLQHRGVLVDYIGDELMAMWGAPKEQPDHARLACSAALEMLNKLPDLNRRWEPVLKEPLDLGVGINTGVARVGNTGSQQKFKYGPLGHTVNLASRLQGATKYLRARLLVSGATHAQLGKDFPAREIGKVRVVNIPDPVDLFELAAPGQSDWPVLQQSYEQALAAFQAADFRRVGQIIGRLLLEHPGDGPSLVLLSRALDAIIEPPEKFDPIWELPGK